ncbi:MAG: hypothetical protein R3C42_01690 [Parvularculaceae bacterium]
MAEIDKRPDRYAMRRGILDLTGFDAGRQGPLKIERQAGIARIFPVDMPSAFEFLRKA